MYDPWSVLPDMERETVSYEYRAAPGMAMTGNRDNDTPVQPQPERDSAIRREAVAGNGGSRFVEILPGVKDPWSWYAASHLMISHRDSGCRGQMESLYIGGAYRLNLFREVIAK